MKNAIIYLGLATALLASCSQKEDVDSPSSVPVPEAVDLGLSSGVKWASFNLGASKPEEYGYYYAWGETETKTKDDYSWATYKWCMGDWNTMTNYCSKSDYGYNGFTDTKTILNPKDDAAHANLGGNWRMPTLLECLELKEKCTWTGTTQNGVNGRLVTGPNGNSIFLPAAGVRYDTDLDHVGATGAFWSSSLSTDHPYAAVEVLFYSDKVEVTENYRCRGISVRPVCK